MRIGRGAALLPSSPSPSHSSPGAASFALSSLLHVVKLAGQVLSLSLSTKPKAQTENLSTPSFFLQTPTATLLSPHKRRPPPPLFSHTFTAHLLTFVPSSLSLPLCLHLSLSLSSLLPDLGLSQPLQTCAHYLTICVFVLRPRFSHKQRGQEIERGNRGDACNPGETPHITGETKSLVNKRSMKRTGGEGEIEERSVQVCSGHAT